MKITRLHTVEQGGLSIKNCPHGDAYIAHTVMGVPFCNASTEYYGLALEALHFIREALWHQGLDLTDDSVVSLAQLLTDNLSIAELEVYDNRKKGREDGPYSLKGRVGS